MTDPDLATRPRQADAHGRVQLYDLVYFEEGDEVTVGRPGNGDYIVLPADGAAVVRRLAAGASVQDVGGWYRDTYGEPLDLADFLDGLDECGFIRAEPAPLDEAPARPVRWHKLARLVFSPVTAFGYGLLLAAWVGSMLRQPRLLPEPHNIFFTHYVSIIAMTFFVVQIPLLLLHESAHALAGRRLGLHTRLSIGRRMQFVVFETTMNGLVAVPRRQRFLPILAGMLTDLGISAVAGLVAAARISPDGRLDAIAGFALSLSYLTLLRFLWQFWFFLRTDVYYLIVTVLGCVDLHTAARQQLSNQLRRLIRRPPLHDPRQWHPRDRAAAQWYAPLLLVGYLACAASLLFGWLPAVVHIVRTVISHLATDDAGWRGLLDSIVFLILNLVEVGLVAGMAIAARRRISKGARHG